MARLPPNVRQGMMMEPNGTVKSAMSGRSRQPVSGYFQSRGKTFFNILSSFPRDTLCRHLVTAIRPWALVTLGPGRKGSAAWRHVAAEVTCLLAAVT